MTRSVAAALALSLCSVGCGEDPPREPTACEQIEAACAAPDERVLELFAAAEAEVQACADEAEAAMECAPRLEACLALCGAPSSTTAEEILGCWESAPAGASRRVLCLGEDHVPPAVREAGHGALAFAVWRGERGAETRTSSGAFELVQEEDVLRLHLDEMPGEQLCAAVRRAGALGLATGDLARSCAGDDELTLGWAEAAQPTEREER